MISARCMAILRVTAGRKPQPRIEWREVARQAPQEVAPSHDQEGFITVRKKATVATAGNITLLPATTVSHATTPVQNTFEMLGAPEEEEEEGTAVRHYRVACRGPPPWTGFTVGI